MTGLLSWAGYASGEFLDGNRAVEFQPCFGTAGPYDPCRDQQITSVEDDVRALVQRRIRNNSGAGVGEISNPRRLSAIDSDDRGAHQHSPALGLPTIYGFDGQLRLRVPEETGPRLCNPAPSAHS